MSGTSLESARELAAIATALSGRILPVTAPIYLAASETDFAIIGTAVLVRFGEARILITAGHVLDQRSQGQLICGVSPELVSVAGELTRLRSPSGDDSLDKIDIGMVRLEGPEWARVPEAGFASVSDLDLERPEPVGHSYALIGFPVSLNKRPVESPFATAYAYRMVGIECGPDAYEDTATNARDNLMLGFDKQQMWSADGMRTAPDLYGSSGAGLWRFGRRLRDTKSAPRLAAIGIEWHKRGRHRHVLGTRIGICTDALATKYPDITDCLNSERGPASIG